MPHTWSYTLLQLTYTSGNHAITPRLDTLASGPTSSKCSHQWLLLLCFAGQLSRKVRAIKIQLVCLQIQQVCCSLQWLTFESSIRAFNMGDRILQWGTIYGAHRMGGGTSYDNTSRQNTPLTEECFIIYYRWPDAMRNKNLYRIECEGNLSLLTLVISLLPSQRSSIARATTAISLQNNQTMVYMLSGGVLSGQNDYPGYPPVINIALLGGPEHPLPTQ
jgi:hypothetical protein